MSYSEPCSNLGDRSSRISHSKLRGPQSIKKPRHEGTLFLVTTSTQACQVQRCVTCSYSSYMSWHCIMYAVCLLDVLEVGLVGRHGDTRSLSLWRMRSISDRPHQRSLQR